MRDYLLSPEHPVGRAKARFFNALGFDRSEWSALRATLLRIGVEGEAQPAGTSVYGRKYEVRGVIRTPQGREAEVVTVWIVLRDEQVPRLVTAYPG